MNDTGNEFDRTADILSYEVSDETLEIAAGDERAGRYTLYFCTALDLCPGP
jgi:phosphopentomutase